MSWFEDAIGNVGTFLGINPDTKKKKPQVVEPTNTLRQQVVRPAKNIVAPIQNIDNITSIREQAIRNNKAELERKRREEAAKKAVVAQQQRQTRQVPVMPVNREVPYPARVPNSSIDKAKRAIDYSVKFGGNTNTSKQINLLKSEMSKQSPNPATLDTLSNSIKRGTFSKVNNERQKKLLDELRKIPTEEVQKAIYNVTLKPTIKTVETVGNMGAKAITDIGTDQRAKDEANRTVRESFNESGPGMLFNSINTIGTVLGTAKAIDDISKQYPNLSNQQLVDIANQQTSPVGINTNNSELDNNLAIAGSAFDIAASLASANLGKPKIQPKNIVVTKADKVIANQLNKNPDIQTPVTPEGVARVRTIREKSTAQPAGNFDTTGTLGAKDSVETLSSAIGHKPISQNAVNGLVKGNTGAAINILRASGRRFAPDVERTIAEQLSYANTPEQVNGVLKNFGIPVQETPAQALARQKALGDKLTAEQTKALEDASTQVTAKEPVPNAINNTEVATPSADIAQNNIAPTVRTSDEIKANLVEARKTPIDQRTPEQSAEITRLEAEAKTAKEASDFLAVRQKLANNEPLTPKEERIYQKVMGTPQEEGAVKRALTPEEQRTPEPGTPVNPALVMTDTGKVKVLKKGGKAANNQAQTQQALLKDAENIKTTVDRDIKPIENLVRDIEYLAPETGKVMRNVQDEAQTAVANQTRSTNADINTVDDIFKGTSKQDMEDIKYAVENFSNPKVINKFKKQYPDAYERASKVRSYLESKLVEINKALSEYGEKPIGNIKDYFPRIQKYLNDPKSKIGNLLRQESQNATFGDAKINKSFQEHRTLDEAFGPQANPYDSMMAYAHQANALIHRLPAVKRLNSVREILKEAKEVPQEAKNQLEAIFKNMSDQLTNANRPKTRAQKITNAVVGISSKSGIAGSINTLITQVASQVPFYTKAVVDSGIIKGTGDLLKFNLYALQNLRYHFKDVQKMAQIDGMESDYIINAIGTKHAKRDKAGRAMTAAFRASSLGDVQFRAASVRTLYERAVKNGASRGMETLKKAENDTKLALQDRSMGARSRFTSSGNAAARLASQYQIEQIGQVYTYIDGVLRNPKASPARKFFATLAAAGGAYGINQATKAISGGTVAPAPDIIGAMIDAFGTVDQMNQDRVANGDNPYTDAEKAALVFANTASSFISNLPLGRTALSTTSAVLTGVTGDKNAAKSIGLNPRDTNPFQTLPAIGTLTALGGDVADTVQGKVSLLEGALTAASRVIPVGAQLRRTAQGIATFVQGEDNYAPTDEQKAAGEHGDVKFKINNDLSTGEGKKNLIQSVAFGRYANTGAQDYIKSGFKKQSERDVKNKTYTDAEVNQLTPEQTASYTTAVRSRFRESLSGKEKSLYKIIKNNDEITRQIKAGKVTEDEVQTLKAKMNRNLYDNGLGYTIDNGFNSDEKGRAQFKSFSPELQQFITKKSIETAKAFKAQDVSNEAKAVIALATVPDEAWPTVTDIKPTNALADKYVTYQKELSEAGNDQAAQFTARKKFWSAAVKQNFDSKAVGIYDSSDEGGTTNSKATYGMSISNIKKLASLEGLTVGKENYKINKKDLDAMIELDNRLLKAGLISKPKFSNKTRAAFGYGTAPLSEIDGLGYSESTGGGGGSSDRTGVGSLLTSYGGGSIKSFSDLPNRQVSTPKLDIAQFQNQGKRAGKSSITIKL